MSDNNYINFVNEIIFNHTFISTFECNIKMSTWLKTSSNTTYMIVYIQSSSTTSTNDHTIGGYHIARDYTDLAATENRGSAFGCQF